LTFCHGGFGELEKCLLYQNIKAFFYPPLKQLGLDLNILRQTAGHKHIADDVVDHSPSSFTKKKKMTGGVA